MYCSKCGAELAKDALFCSNCGEKTKSSNIQNIPTTELKEYLNHAKTLEVNRYTLNTTINRLQDKINSLGIKNVYRKPIFKRIDFQKTFLKIFYLGLIICIIGIIIGICLNNRDIENLSFTALFVIVPLSILTGLIALIVKYNTRNKTYKNNVACDIVRVEKEKLQISELKKQQADLQKEISNIELLMDKLYSSNIIYPKYRELVPIVTMCEYIDSGRCTELFGANGAYNLYESESRQDIIISNLSQAVSMLAQIRDNQYALYEAIQESNEIADRVYSQSERMLSVNQEISKNSALTAYNAKITAENSTISTYIDFCKF